MKRVGTFEGRGTESPKVSFILYTTRSTSECRRGERERKKKERGKYKKETEEWKGEIKIQTNHNHNHSQMSSQIKLEPDQTATAPKTLQRKEVHNFQT
jgi:hypothetical protein